MVHLIDSSGIGCGRNGTCKDGIRALLLCRVCVGKFYYTQGREPTAIDKYTAGEADSTLGDRAKSVNTYREIVVYDADQAPAGSEGDTSVAWCGR